MVRSPNCDRARFCQGALISKFGDYTVIPCAHAACTHTRRRTRPFFPHLLPSSCLAFVSFQAAIEWSDIYRATNRDNTPTPGYLFNDIVSRLMEYAIGWGCFDWAWLTEVSFRRGLNSKISCLTQCHQTTKQRKSKKQTDESSLLLDHLDPTGLSDSSPTISNDANALIFTNALQRSFCKNVTLPNATIRCRMCRTPVHQRFPRWLSTWSIASMVTMPTSNSKHSLWSRRWPTGDNFHQLAWQSDTVSCLTFSTFVPSTFFDWNDSIHSTVRLQGSWY